MLKYIYIATNKHMPGLLKIGFSRSPTDRLKSLHTTGVPSPFELAALFPVSSGGGCETAIHAALSQFRTDRKREFFALSLPLAMELIMPIVAVHLPPPDKASPHHSEEQGFRFTTRLERNEHTIIHWIFRGRHHTRARKGIYAVFERGFQKSVDHAIEHLLEQRLIARLPPAEAERFAVTTKGSMYVRQFPEAE